MVGGSMLRRVFRNFLSYYYYYYYYYYCCCSILSCDMR